VFEADYVDIFEVRGIKREGRGEVLPPVVEADRVQLAYRGLDQVVRRTTLHFSPPPASLTGVRAEYETSLPPHGEAIYFFTVACEPPNRGLHVPRFDDAAAAAAEERRVLSAATPHLFTSNEQLNDWLVRSKADLDLMTTYTEHGPYPYAGVPWYSTVFGRDGVITALSYLWADPSMARGVLEFLAANQAREVNEFQDAEPGKILHETRRGEMAALHEIPFGRYYGSVDATPLFVVLAGAYYQRTGDIKFVRSLWPHIEAALEWIEKYGDVDGDGFVEYWRRSKKGLIVQGWRDSFDAVFHADGSLADGPVALCEVQGYVYAARRAAAELAACLGHHTRAHALTRQAEELRRSFEDAFWCDDISTYALALDGSKKPCRVRASNAGHCLFSGIASPERAARVARTLLSEESFSGWGIRTVASNEIRYNPMSYHNGSVWPHDNALIAAGFARYGLLEGMHRVFTGIFDASIFVDMHRMPELYCGFPRRPGEGPTLYPVACAPQSWSAAVVFSMLQSMLGLTIDAPKKQIRFERSVMPEAIKNIRIRNLRIGEATVDLALQRYALDVGIELLRRDGEVEIVAVK
ncbi:MAG TPA: amylo-alpha-1,6-glucosidase, partial [Candidatus Krumholzibacteria bacterium]|nr:amylo-alpha-1,6-glucosidase [Candidatus Krumholzibacteria bacterium]